MIREHRTWSPDAEALPGPVAVVRARDAAPGVAGPLGPVLIRVPALGGVPGGPRVRRAPVRSAVRRRRRLRREVRMAGSALLIGLPVTWAGWFAWGGHGCEPEPVGVPARLIGIESLNVPLASADELTRLAIPVSGHRTPAGAAAAAPVGTVVARPVAPAHEACTPVVLPGYVLPDDGSEEPPHAGS